MTPYIFYLDGVEIKTDAVPFEVNNRLFVPLRSISEATGAKVLWDGESVTVYRDTDRLMLTIGSNIVVYNDVALTVDAMPILRDGRTFLPIRFVLEWFGLHVNHSEGRVDISAPPYIVLLDTMYAPRGNTNANLNNETQAIIWQNRLFKSHHLYNNALYSLDLESDKGSVLVTDASPRYFNIWNDNLYVNLFGNFVQIDLDGSILQTVIEDVGYVQIHNNWIYFIRESDGQLCRRLLLGGEIQPLGVFRGDVDRLFLNCLELVITDQHIFVNDGSSILRMGLDGSNRARIFSVYAHIISEWWGWYLRGLEYSGGFLFFNIGGNSAQAKICRLNIDGTGLKILVTDGAAEINASGDWLYYTMLRGHNVSDMIPESVFLGDTIVRIRVDGSGREVLTHVESTRASRGFSSPTLMPDGSIFFRFWESMNPDTWIRFDNVPTAG